MPPPNRVISFYESILNALAQIACLRLRSFAINLSAADGSLVFVKAKARNCLWAQPTTKTPRRSIWSAGELLLPSNTRIGFYFALDCS